MTDYELDIEEVGVPRGEGEAWDDLADRRRREQRPTFQCCLCGETHNSRGEATRCCSEYFE